MATASTPDHGFIMTPDQIFVTDVGVDSITNTFYRLSIGQYVYDFNFNEITMRDLERVVDPNDVMNPIFLRGYLWKTLPSRLWQVEDGHQLGPMPAQPGLDSHLSSVYYGDRRARQREAQPVIRDEKQVAGCEQSSPDADSKHDAAPRQHHNMRRTLSCSFGEEESIIQREAASTVLRRHSISSLGDFVIQGPENTLCEVVSSCKDHHLRSAVHATNGDYTYSNHLRKGSSSLDSGVDVGSIDGSSETGD